MIVTNEKFLKHYEITPNSRQEHYVLNIRIKPAVSSALFITELYFYIVRKFHRFLENIRESLLIHVEFLLTMLQFQKNIENLSPD